MSRSHDFSDRSAAEFFGGMSESYDSLIRRCVPRYEEMLRCVLEYCPDRVARILELGCGTGNLTAKLAARYPDAEIVFVDASVEMVEFTQARLDHRQKRGVVGRFEELTGLVEGPFDLVVSGIAMHHVLDKAQLYQAIADLLRPGARLVFADQLQGGSEFNHQRNWEMWLEFCRLPDHCSEDEVQDLLDHADAHDHYTPLAVHFAELETAGFRGLDCVWRNLIWGVVTADRK